LKGVRLRIFTSGDDEVNLSYSPMTVESFV